MSTTLEQFDIRNFTDRLTPGKTRGKYECPVCGGNDLAIDPKSGAYSCFNSGCDPKDIREAIRPFSEALAEVRGDSSYVPRQIVRAKPSDPKPAPLPESIELAKLADDPKFSKALPCSNIPDSVRKEITEAGCDSATCTEQKFAYSEGQWVSRYQWSNPHKPKGYSKTFRQWHVDSEGRIRSGKGDRPWTLYQECEAIGTGKGNWIVWVEGEATADAVRWLGFPTVTAQGSSWNRELEASVSRLKQGGVTGIVFFPDNDPTGAEKARKLEQVCAKVGMPIVSIDPLALWGEMPEHGDVVDWLRWGRQNGMERSDFIKRIEEEIHAAVAARQAEPTQDVEGKLKAKKLPPPSILAAEISEQYRDKLAFDANSQRWFSYELENPGQWTPISDEFADSTYQGIIESRIEAFNFGFVSNVKKLARGKLIVRKWEERSAKELLPFQNGVLEISTGKLLSHSPGYRFTWQLPRQHNVLASSWSNIDKFLDEVTGGNRAIRNILECFGNALLKGRSDLQRFLFLIGEGGTGKGSFMRLLTALVGQENVHSSTLVDFCGNQFESANAFQKRAVFFWDEDRKVGNLGKFKSLTGGDWLRGEEKGKKAFQFKFDGMVAISANFPIFAGDSSSGLSRRVITVPFNNRIPRSQRKNLDQLFEKELDAFTNYLLKLDDDFVTSTLLGLDDIPICTYEFWENRQRTDSIASWLNDWVVFDEYGETPIGNRQNETEIQYEATTLYGSYALHCRQSGTSPKSSKNFSPDLVELCNSILGMAIEKVHTKTGKYLKGVRLRTPSDDNIPTYDYALLDRVTNPGDGSVTGGDGSGDGSVTGRVTGQNSLIAGDSAILGVEVTGKVELKERIQTDNHKPIESLDLQAKSLHETNEINSDPSPSPKPIQNNGFDPSPHPSPHPSPTKIDDLALLLTELISEGSLDSESLEALTSDLTEQTKRQLWEKLSLEVRESLKSLKKLADQTPAITESSPKKAFRIGDRVAGSNPEEKSYNWHGEVKGFKENGLIRVWWQERANSDDKRVQKTPELSYRPENLRRI